MWTNLTFHSFLHTCHAPLSPLVPSFMGYGISRYMMCNKRGLGVWEWHATWDGVSGCLRD